MYLKTAGTVVFFVCATSLAFSDRELPRELTAIREAYEASMENLHSGSGTGIYECYASSNGKASKLQLIQKAKVKVIFDHKKFYIRLDYEKDDIHRLESRIIVYDGTAVLVNRTSKYIQPAHSEADIYEAKPNLPVMRQTGFDYNPSELPSNILPGEFFTNPKYTAAVTVKTEENKDISGTFSYSSAPHVHCSFLASQKAGHNIVAYAEFLSNHNNFLHVNCQAIWGRKTGVWYVKSIDTQCFHLDGVSERSLFQYTDFAPNPEVPKSQFSFDALKLPSQAALVDRRPNAEVFILKQSQSSSVDTAKLDTLADKVKSLAPSTAPEPRSKLVRYILLALGGLLCLLGLSFMWRRRVRSRNVSPAE
jgi:hypothetical protein